MILLHRVAIREAGRGQTVKGKGVEKAQKNGRLRCALEI